MDLRITMRHGLRYDLLLTIPLEELQDIRLSVPGWAHLRKSYGIVRHPIPGVVTEEDLKPTATFDPLKQKVVTGSSGIRRYKLPPQDHLSAGIMLPEHGSDAVPGLNALDPDGCVNQRIVLVGNRNLGNNYGFTAWDSGRSPHCFYLLGEPVGTRTYTCLTWRPSEGPTIQSLRFQQDGDDYRPVAAADPASTSLGDVVWCTYGQQVLRAGKLVDTEDLLTEFYDLRHLFHFNLKDPSEQEHLRALTALYGDTAALKEAVLGVWHGGRPRSRYFHNATGIGHDRLVIVQRHGTPEELGQWLLEAGAEDGILLDNGGSAFTWGWFAGTGHTDGRRRGGVVFSSPDWRPPSISCLAITLKGSARHNETPGSVSFSVT